MAKEVIRSIRTTFANCLMVDEDENTFHKEVNVPGWYKRGSLLTKRVRKIVEDGEDGAHLVKIIGLTEVVAKYAMPIDTFIANATLIPPTEDAETENDEDESEV